MREQERSVTLSAASPEAAAVAGQAAATKLWPDVERRATPWRVASVTPSPLRDLFPAVASQSWQVVVVREVL